MKNILITGGAGFVGSSLGLEIKKHYADYEIFCLDNLKRRGSELHLARLKSAGIHFVHGDIRIKEDFEGLPKIDLLIDASAEPSVLAGIPSGPDYLLQTNLFGTINCLNFALKNAADFIFLSTSRVYPIKGLESILYSEAETRFVLHDSQSQPGVTTKGISEEFPLQGMRSLYGASKLASELIIQEYTYMYGLRTVVNRCGIITGPWQMGKADQGVVVYWVAQHFWNKKLCYMGFGGNGKQVRDILHVKDLFRLIDWQMNNLSHISGETFNVGGGNAVSLSLLELTQICRKVTGNTIEITPVRETRIADIPLYVSDTTKISKCSGWEPKILPETIIEDIYQWISDHEKNLMPVLNYI